ncbi:thioredoxin family protein [Kitasatospora sp. NPDC004240]
MTAVTTGCASAGAPATAGAATGPSTGTVATTSTSTAPSASTASTAPKASSSAAAGAPGSYDPSRNAAADISAALAQSATDARPVLLDFGADWCPDCRVLEKLFRSPEVQPILREKYRVVSVDVGEFDRNLDVAAHYVDLEHSGIPALVVLGPDGTVRTASNDGRFSNARTLSAAQLATYLTRWSL